MPLHFFHHANLFLKKPLLLQCCRVLSLAREPVLAQISGVVTREE